MNGKDKLTFIFNEIKCDLYIVKREMLSLIKYLEIYKNTSNEYSN